MTARVIASEAKQSVTEAPVVVVHSLAHATAALKAAARAGRPVVLASAPGPGVMSVPAGSENSSQRRVRRFPRPAVHPCSIAATTVGAALAAIRSEVEGVVFTGRADVARRLADIASQHGVRFVTERPVPALDLGDDFFAAPEILERRCAELFR